MPNILYKFFAPQPHTHYAMVEMQLSDFTQKDFEQNFLDIKMPVWTPGSYLVREYTKNVESFEAFFEGEIEIGEPFHQRISFQKIRKNIWRIDLKILDVKVSELKNINLKKLKITVKYNIYCYELSVRTNFITENRIFINGASTFIYVENYRNLPLQIEIETPHFQYIHTALQKNNAKNNQKNIKKNKHLKFSLNAKNYDELVDSPIEINNTPAIEMLVQDIPHSFCFNGLDMTTELEQELKQDLTKIITTATEMFGSNPCTHYVTMTQFVHKGYGGLEHCFSTALIFGRDEMRTEEGYMKFLTLFAHEYFHLWNVKRLCPTDLTDFDYDNENYTELLWEVEGFTTYFQDIIMLKAGLINAEKFKTIQLERIKNIAKNHGTKVQSLAESSIDAWIKFYRPNENSDNANISYYSKGAIIALLLDILMIENSDKNLGDLMKTLYEIFYLNKIQNNQKIGFDTPSLKAQLEIFTNQNLDDFFAKYINGTAEIPFNYFFAKIGLHLSITPTEKVILGITQQILDASGERKITFVRKESFAHHLGLQVYDQIIAVNGKVEQNLAEFLENQQPNNPIEITVLRDGKLITLKGVTQINYEMEYKLDVLPNIYEVTQEKIKQNFEKWCRV